MVPVLEPQIRLRGARKSDLEACYAISLATGLAGGDAAHIYRDPRMMGHIYAAPYVLLEPGLAFVVEDDDGVAGFALGAVDTDAWEDRLEHDWWPSLRTRYADPSDLPADQRTPDQRRAWMIHHPSRTPPEIVAAWHAHLHMNLLPRRQRSGAGTALLDRWWDAARARGMRACHVGVNRENAGGAAFWRKRGFAPLSPDPQPGGRTLWMGRST